MCPYACIHSRGLRDIKGPQGPFHPPLCSLPSLGGPTTSLWPIYCVYIEMQMII